MGERGGRHARLERVALGPVLHGARRRGDPELPAVLGDQPTGDGGQPLDRDAQPGEVVGAHRPAAVELGGGIGSSGRGREIDGTALGSTAPPQRRRIGVQDEHAPGHRMPARIAQHAAVARAQRQRGRQGQPRQVVAERPHVHRHRGGADVQDEPGRAIGGDGEPRRRRRCGASGAV